jgi:predicted outer membrane protein
MATPSTSTFLTNTAVANLFEIETVAMFEAYAKGGDNARMKQFANEMLPTLKTHLDQVSKLK